MVPGTGALPCAAWPPGILWEVGYMAAHTYMHMPTKLTSRLHLRTPRLESQQPRLRNRTLVTPKPFYQCRLGRMTIAVYFPVYPLRMGIQRERLSIWHSPSSAAQTPPRCGLKIERETEGAKPARHSRGCCIS